jgi:prepilin peptidase CpaA
MEAIGLPQAASLIIAAGAFAFSAASDLRTYRIPNRYSAIAAGAFAVMAMFMPVAFFWGGLAAGALTFAITAFMFSRGWMGGGDVKLFTAAAMWAGPPNFMQLVIVTSVAGLVIAATMLSPLGRFMAAPTGSARPSNETLWSAVGRPMPFGVAIAAGALFVLSRL